LVSRRANTLRGYRLGEFVVEMAEGLNPGYRSVEAVEVVP